MPLIDCVQRSPEHIAARLGKVTGCRIKDVTAKGKDGGPSASRANYMADLVLERLTGIPMEGHQSKAMLDGIEREPEARRAYELRTGLLVHETGFWDHPTIALAGASPDGLIDVAQFSGGVEIKCPGVKQHMETLLNGAISVGGHLKQIMWNMACTERKWWDFVSWHPAFPEPMRLFIQRVDRYDPMIAVFEGAVIKFLAETDEKLTALRRRFEKVERK